MSKQNDVDNTKREPKLVSGKDFLAQGEAEYKERLQSGVTVNNLKVFFQKDNLTIQFRGTEPVSYEIDLERCRNSNELLNWIFHLKSKSWEPGLIYAFIEMLDDACSDIFGFPAQTLYQPGNNLDWKNGTYSSNKSKGFKVR